jgi:hypothetical protein
MARAQKHHPIAEAGRQVASTTQPAVSLLLQAYDYSQELKTDVWDLAMEIARLRAVGLRDTILRWLASKGYVELGLETTSVGVKKRTFRRLGRGALSERTCVVLTRAGATWARRARPKQRLRAEIGVESISPSYDSDRRELRVGSCIVKEFKQPAPSQELVLASFEEEGWPYHIDDPLPPEDGQDPKQRLHNTINNLNRNQRYPLIHFYADTKGRGIRWTF